jgi:type III secretion protein Q
MLARLLDERAGAIRAEVDLPVMVCLRLAAATVSVSEIATLSPGDVVLVERCCGPAPAAVAVIAEHFIAPVELTPAGARIVAPPIRGHGSIWEWSMENVREQSGGRIPRDTDLDDLPVKLVFELGRLELSLGEIRQLVPGALLPLARPLEESLDIVANGRRIGRGALVQLGDSLGVRITRLFDNA